MTDRMRMETPDLTEKNIEKIGELFPNCITESKDEKGNLKKAINFDILKQMLSKEIVDGDEAYEFTWVGKKAAMLEANKPIRKTLRPCPEESLNWDTTQNLYIEGDNLEVLKLLQESYLGKVKMIYIDPPYNTGNDFIYKDDFAQSVDEYEEESGQVDEEGNRLFKNSETNGRFHSDWCSMMYSRLMVARNLLSDDGVIFISIDDNEVENLKKICDEIFGEDNFINYLNINLKNIAGASGGGEDKRLKKNIEYIVLYAKNYFTTTKFENVYTYTPIHELVEEYRNNGISWKYTSVLVNSGEKNYIGSTKDGEGNEIKIYRRDNYDIKSISQIMKDEQLTEKEVYEKYANFIFQTAMPQSSIRPRVMNYVKQIGIESDLYSIEYVPKTGRNKGILYEQFYKGENFRLFAWLKDVTEQINGILCKKDIKGTYWDYVGETKNLSKEGDVIFPNGKKPVKLIKALCSMNIKNDDIILDFFSGSATTAHAVMQLNSEDGGNRKFIMVQLQEPCDEKSEAYKAGFKNICEIGKERIRRAGKKILEEYKNTPFVKGGCPQSGQGDYNSLYIDEKPLCQQKLTSPLKKGSEENTHHQSLTTSYAETSAGCAPTKVGELASNSETEGVLFKETNKDRPLSALRATSPNSKALGADLVDVGFRVFKLADSNMKDVYYSADEYSQQSLQDFVSNIKEDRTDLDLLFGCLLEWGLPLSMPYSSEKINGFNVHTYNDGDLIACFDENISEEVIKIIAKRNPLRAVFRDSSFANSPSKINVTEIFKLLSPNTRVKVI